MGFRHAVVDPRAAAAVGLAAVVLAARLAAQEPDHRARLEAAPTHGEWVKYVGRGGDSVVAYLAYPERRDPAPAVIVIHEIFGLSDWVRTVVDDLAGRGYVAIGPDLLSRRGGTKGADEARAVIRDLPPDSITVDLDATFDYLRSLRTVRGAAIGVIGFCWGGGQAFRYATSSTELRAAVVCYGPAPQRNDLAGIMAPVFGVYAENDARINQDLPQVDAAMRELGKRYRYTIYPGAGHAFLRRGDPATEVERAWKDIFAFFQRELER